MIPASPPATPQHSAIGKVLKVGGLDALIQLSAALKLFKPTIDPVRIRAAPESTRIADDPDIGRLRRRAERVALSMLTTGQHL